MLMLYYDNSHDNARQYSCGKLSKITPVIGKPGGYPGFIYDASFSAKLPFFSITADGLGLYNP